MNKLELITELARRQRISKAESAQVIEIFFEAMIQELCKGGRVEIRVLCAFKFKEYSGYTGRNPRSVELVKVKPKKRPFFNCGTDLKQRADR